jgi:hypothetical protein
VERVEGRLRAALGRQRAETLTNAWLTVLCTPVFVAMAAAVVTVVVALVLGLRADGDVLDHAMTFYTTVNIFLASMLVFVLAQSNESLSDFDLHPAWIAGLIVFLVILGVTYATSWSDRYPWAFGLGYAVAGLALLALIGQAPLPEMPNDVEERDSMEIVRRLILAVPALIASAYGQVFRGCWLWKPPGDTDVRIASRALCRLADDPTDPLHAAALDARIAALLARLELIETTDEGYILTDKGQTFITDALEPSACRAKLKRSKGASHE